MKSGFAPTHSIWLQKFIERKIGVELQTNAQSNQGQSRNKKTMAFIDK
jgi:hypothetical protein